MCPELFGAGSVTGEEMLRAPPPPPWPIPKAECREIASKYTLIMVKNSKGIVHISAELGALLDPRIWRIFFPALCLPPLPLTLPETFSQPVNGNLAMQ